MNRRDVAETQQRRGFWLRTLHRWHWISAAVALAGMLLFAVTGITLNHAGRIESTPHTTHRTTQLPPQLRKALGGREDGNAPLPVAVAQRLDAEFGIALRGRDAEWSAEEVYVSFPSPGADAWLNIDRGTGAVEYERTDRGWIAYFNDLHKGRNAGPAWGLFIDAFALACAIFSITGLCLLQLHAGQRPGTWPWIGLGVVLPLLIALLLVH